MYTLWGGGGVYIYIRFIHLFMHRQHIISYMLYIVQLAFLDVFNVFLHKTVTSSFKNGTPTNTFEPPSCIHNLV